MSEKQVRLIECCKTKCGYIHLETERIAKPADGWNAMVCPKCGMEDFWTLNEKGQQKNHQEAVDLSTIEPSPRMGLKRRRRIFSAKRRALEGGAA